MEQRDLYVGIEKGIVKGFYPDILCSGAAEPCIVVAVYDPKSRSGYMIHNADYHSDGSLEEFVSVVSKDYKKLSRLRVYAAGGSIDSLQSLEVVKRNRKHAEKILADNFDKKKTTIQWLETGYFCELFLDLYKGEFSIEVESTFEGDYEKMQV